MNTHLLSRRTFLRGAGVTMALPWLESLAVWADEPGHTASLDVGGEPVHGRSCRPGEPLRQVVGQHQQLGHGSP